MSSCPAPAAARVPQYCAARQTDTLFRTAPGLYANDAEYIARRLICHSSRQSETFHPVTLSIRKFPAIWIARGRFTIRRDLQPASSLTSDLRGTFPPSNEAVSTSENNCPRLVRRSFQTNHAASEAHCSAQNLRAVALMEAGHALMLSSGFDPRYSHKGRSWL